MSNLILTSNNTYNTNISEYTYNTLSQGNYSGNIYPYGASFLGIEVGQRTPTFNTDYNNIITPIYVSRDIIYPTKLKQIEKLNSKNVGFYSLPSWLLGSSRNLVLPLYENNTLFDSISDLFNIANPSHLLKSARLSIDPFGGLSTGPAAPRYRQAYYLQTNNIQTSSLGSLYTNNLTIRPSDSLYDFITATDPIYIILNKSNNILIRNIDTYKQVNISLQNILPDASYSIPYSIASGSIGNITEDANALFSWSGINSLSDNIYIPPVLADNPGAFKLDVSMGLCNLFNTCNYNNFIYPSIYGPAYNIPRNKVFLNIDSNDPLEYNTSKYLNTINNITTNNISYGLFLTPSSGTHVINDGTNVIGQASPIDLVNGYDHSGEFIGVLRKQGESDIRYSGRQQRIMAAALQNITPCTENSVSKVISALTGRSIITDVWDGNTNSLIPTNTVTIDSLVSDTDKLVLSLVTSTIIPINYLNNITPLLSYNANQLASGGITTTSTNTYITYSQDNTQLQSQSVFKCSENLSYYDNVKIRINSVIQIPGRDYIISSEDPSIILLSTPISVTNTTTMIVVLSNRNRIKLTLYNDAIDISDYSTWNLKRSNKSINAESFNSLYKEYVSTIETPLLHGATQISNSMNSISYPVSGMSGDIQTTSYYANLLISRGPKVTSLSRIENRRLYYAGKAYPTPFGKSIFDLDNTNLWSSPVIKSKINGGTPTDVSKPPYYV